MQKTTAQPGAPMRQEPAEGREEPEEKRASDRAPSSSTPLECTSNSKGAVAMAALVARAVIGDGLVAEIYENGVVWISHTRGKQQSFELTGDAPAHLLAFLSRHREVLQQPEQDLEDLQVEQE